MLLLILGVSNASGHADAVNGTFSELATGLRFSTSEGEFTGGEGEEQDMVDVVHYAQEQFGVGGR